ncbi:hypothetical protein RRG08_046895 [Elysia crispata]|uniref:Uncharacterized protein n=1 Tax=Elysia crispata TaxID=231223 RepID=A0AAE0ZIB5_9GAST|nr:hypothetical protein RRG08_046895 [Elysia crispata]
MNRGLGRNGFHQAVSWLWPVIDMLSERTSVDLYSDGELILSQIGLPQSRLSCDGCRYIWTTGIHREQSHNGCVAVNITEGGI